MDLKASTFDSIHEASLKRILVPTDFSLGADNALEYAVRLSKFKQAEIFLLHVFNLAEYLSVLSQETDVDPKTAERVLEAAPPYATGKSRSFANATDRKSSSLNK